jgi:formylglycine-generating enzyme required for sulfatase activity
MASTIKEESVLRHRATWDEAVASIADSQSCPAYQGLIIQPQMGMVPLGRDPVSGLWEFVHLQTGTIPTRNEEGVLEINEDTGMVFVLIPAGAFRMGAEQPSETRPLGSPNVDPRAIALEGPVHTVTVEPFLLAKYEMTQGQWLRFTGNNPSRYHPGMGRADLGISLQNPVESVSWEDCNRELLRMNLRLPTEAEWEYACRAGTTTIYWTGDTYESINGKANLFDQGVRERRDGEPPLWNDPYPCHAPVGLFVANPFGLHNLLGNVSEWCQDRFGAYDKPPRDGSESTMRDVRIARGGNWQSLFPRSAYRIFDSPGSMYLGIGVRPAATLQAPNGANHDR